ncbi:4'-phosphopantetheinyl transferase superfamily protein [Leeia sp. TBRC 13508]|uniref:4'-phosphopantetheinyl transferase superfamily protein n=1 Tax=Leeia speluncae TaxID=2884804 RepID=A0ABS8D8D3_9NEIS|nr:4'-phosphopantetheinyl transferase superfamily protein [Leeia speluncae]MCB6184475.1 4'-phosphopantetheinyl transferase superfamily protein [Leeia speluncae]
MENNFILSRLIKQLSSPEAFVGSVWQINLSHALEPTDGTIHFLSENEQARAASISHVQSKQHFVLMRAALRCLLSTHYLPSKNPNEIDIQLTASGKPFIKDCPTIQFNLSHTGNIGLIAISTSHPSVGIDIEVISDKRNLLGIAKHFFSAKEYNFYHENQSPSSFYQIWTAKEAYVKCLGSGLSNQMQKISNIPTDKGVFLTTVEAEKKPAISVNHMAVENGYVASIAWLETLN